MAENEGTPQRPDDEDGFAAPSGSTPPSAAEAPTARHDVTDADRTHRHEAIGEPTRTHSWGASEWAPLTEGSGATNEPRNADAPGPVFVGDEGASRKRSSLGWLRWIAVIVVSALIGALTATLVDDNNAGTVVRSDVNTASSPASNAEATPSTIRSVRDRVQPAVVTVNVTSSSGGSGSGTGMIVSSDGEILTNNHVVAGASSIRVTLNNETAPRNARLLGTDPSIDTALLKVDGASNLPVVTFADSDQVQVGDEVVAIGNALALTGGPSVTSGIISAKDRSITDSTSSLTNLIQTDTAINPGNSGGPLANMDGQVIGMNTAVIRGNTGEYENIGFAIAINTVRPAIEDLRQGRSNASQSAYLGLNPVTLDESIRQRYDLTPQQGVVVSQVQADSPADQAGLSRFDVITEVDGRAVVTSDALISLVREKRPNDRVSITYYRGEEERTATATLVARPASNQQ